MSLVIRPIDPRTELHSFAEIQLSAYPSIQGGIENFKERLQLVADHDDTSKYYGVFREGQMVAGMRLLDFRVNYFGQQIAAGGVGSVAVELTEKKKGIAKEMLQYFIRSYREQGAYLTMLYPFRPDFYYKMGFGYGPKANQYSFLPSALPFVKGQQGVRYLTADDYDLLKQFSERYAAKQHGFCQRSSFELQGILRNLASKRTLVGYLEDGELKGYIAFSFQRAHDTNFVKNNIRVHEWLWEDQPAFFALASFIQTQADQINRIVFASQDEYFHFALRDVRDGSDNIIPSVYHQSNTSGVGLMYRITGLKDFLKATSYRNYNSVSLNLNLQVEDSFIPENAGSYHLSFVDGELSLADQPLNGIGLSIDIADLSALLMGSVDLCSLARLGRVQVADCDLPALANLFQAAQRPECVTAF